MGDGEKTVELRDRAFPGATLSRGAFRNQHWIEIRAESLLAVARWLRDSGDTAYDFLTDVTAVHWPDDPQPMEVVYHFFSRSRNDRLRLKVRVGERGPVPSLAGLWASANWNERETYDMFGIVFEGHPDLRRILMPDDYTEHPLRKELPLFRG
jgi:NADH-quinone oxidoreductase subunit C